MVNDVITELHYNGVWNDISTDVRQSTGHVIKWGRDDEASQPKPHTAQLTLDNTAGKYSPQNPLSPLYGLIGRNTPLRARLGAKSPRLRLIGHSESVLYTPDHATLDIVGDIDIRMELKPTSWRPASGSGGMGLARKYVTTGDQRSWAWWLTEAGNLSFRWTTAGTLASAITKTSTATIPDDDAHRAVRVTLDVNNGAAGNDVKFFTAATIAGPWTQLGATVTTGGVTSIFSSSSTVEVGRTDVSGQSGIVTTPVKGDVFAFELRSGIDGTAVGDPELDERSPEETFWTASNGRIWVAGNVYGLTSIVDTSIRFSGEVSSWPPKWDVSGKNIYVPIVASGIQRRLGQGASPVRSAVYRGIMQSIYAFTPPLEYWPMEEGTSADVFASALGGFPVTQLIKNKLKLGDYTDLPSSDPLPRGIPSQTPTTVISSFIDMKVRNYVPNGYIEVSAYNHPYEEVSGSPIVDVISLYTDNEAARIWVVNGDDDGDLRLEVYSGPIGAAVLEFASTYSTNQNIANKQIGIRLKLTNSGSNTLFNIVVCDVNGNEINNATGTVPGRQPGRVTQVSGTVYRDRGSGHYMLRQDTDISDEIYLKWLQGHLGERAGNRFLRLCDEENISVLFSGDPDITTPMSIQRSDTLLGLLRECATAEIGFVTDRRDALGLHFRTRDSLYNQDVALTLDYGSGEVAPTLEPVEDDQLTRNDVTAHRIEGSSYQAVQNTGPLSILAPPDGVGRYDTKVDLSVWRDEMLPDFAGWLLHLGVVDELRYPDITVDLTATPSKIEDATNIVSGDRIQVTNPPTWLPPETIDQMAQGGSETLSPHRHLITYNTSPASPWTLGVIEDPVLGHADTLDSETTASFVAGTDTSLSVATISGPIWTTVAGNFPFDIRVAGVVLTITAIAGAASPQTFTVSTSVVNGIRKTIPSGSKIELAYPAYVGF